MSHADDEAFYTSILRRIAAAIGWERLRALVERLANEERRR